MRTNFAVSPADGTEGAQARDPLDRCYTDPELARAIVRFLYAEGLSPTSRVLENSVGDGAFLLAMLDEGHAPHAITVCDVDPDAPGLALARSRGVRAVCASFLDVAQPGDVWLTPPPFDVAVGNPPYSGATAGNVDGAEAFVRAALVVAPLVCYLLPLLMLGGKARYTDGFYHHLRHVEALSPRPKFHGPGVRSKKVGKKPGGAQMEYGALCFDRVERAAPAWTGGHTYWRAPTTPKPPKVRRVSTPGSVTD